MTPDNLFVDVSYVPTETHFCRSCTLEKSVDDFFKRACGKPKTPCKTCTKKRVALYEAANKQLQQERRSTWRTKNIVKVRYYNLLRMKRAIGELRQLVSRLKVERGCLDCGYNAHPEALDLDHVYGEKLREVAVLVTTGSASLVLAEVAKCEVRCVVCHRLRTERLRLRTGKPSATTLRKREMVRVAKEQPCGDCGLRYPQYAMDFDHIDPSRKVAGISNLYRFSELTLAEELEKCRVLCAICHRLRTCAQRCKS